MAGKGNYRHGYNRKGARTSEYGIWAEMIQRCENPKSKSYRNYGARGITVCERWRNSFVAFLKDVGTRPSSKHTLDRIENNDVYRPGNVRWADRKTQALNSRMVVNITVDGVTKCASDWAMGNGIKYSTLMDRLQRGWDPVEAVTTPRLKRWNRHVRRNTKSN